MLRILIECVHKVERLRGLRMSGSRPVTKRLALIMNSSLKRGNDEARRLDVEVGGIDVEVDGIDVQVGDMDIAIGDFDLEVAGGDVEVGDFAIAGELIDLHNHPWRGTMQNGTTIALPSEKHIEKLLRELKLVNEGIDRFVVLMSAGEKRRSLKPRRGGEVVGETLVNLVKERKLDIPGLSPGEIVAQRARAARLRPLQLAAEGLARSLGDAVFAAESKAWATTTNLYSVLKKMAHRDETLKTQLAPATGFFATGKRKPKTPPAK